MSMNTPQPQENIDNVQPTTPEAAPAPQVETTPAAPVEQTAPTEAQVTPEATQQQEQQVIDTVAQGLADDQITSRDIMTAVLSDSLGLSPQGASSLFDLLMQDLADDEIQDTNEQPME